MKTKAATITPRHWAALEAGSISTIEYGAATLSREDEHFVMRRGDAVHTLLVVATDVRRLDAHWKGFTS